jgi:multiple sugar transport system permease protein
MKWARRDWPYAFVFLAPSLIGMILFTLIPILASFGLAFTDWNLLRPPSFVGLENFKTMFSDRVMWISLRNTFYYALLIVPSTIVASLALALVLRRNFPGITYFRLAFMIPGVSSLVAIAMVWRWLYNDQFGLINAGLQAIGLPAVGWLTNPHVVIPALVLMSLWTGVGFDAIIYLAGLKNIPEHLYEAARLDGASSWQSFRYITLPLLTPIHFFFLITGVIGAFQVFDVIYIMTQGGPGFSSHVYAFHLYNQAFRRFEVGYASAMAWFLFAIVLLLTLVQWRTVGRRVEY